MHTLTMASVCLALSSALLLYGLSYDTRLIETEVTASERSGERLRTDIAVLRAERAHLARPDRIAPIAHSLGLRPTEPRQISGGLQGQLADADHDRP